MEVCIDIISVNKDGIDTIVGNTQFIMVAREGNQSTKVHALSTSGDNQAELTERFDAGKSRALSRREKGKQSLSRSSPRVDEIDVIHTLYLESKDLKAQKNAFLSGAEPIAPVGKMRWMKNTIYKNALLMHPQERNIHGKIFGRLCSLMIVIYVSNTEFHFICCCRWIPHEDCD
jgi:acyl-coenzyme A thioesterase 9